MTGIIECLCVFYECSTRLVNRVQGGCSRMLCKTGIIECRVGVLRMQYMTGIIECWVGVL